LNKIQLQNNFVPVAEFLCASFADKMSFYCQEGLAHLFVEVPRPGNSEVTFLVFESSYQVPPVSTCLTNHRSRQFHVMLVYNICIWT